MSTGMATCNTGFVIFAAVVFLVIALAHLVRLVRGWTIQIGPLSIPHWVSVVGALAGAFTAFWGFSLLFMR
jgi:hypothetical protein